MILREKNNLLDVALIALLLCTFNLPESPSSLLFLSISLVSIVAFRFKATPLSPFFFIAPASIYLAANLFYIYLSGTTGYIKFFTCAFIGLLFFSLALRRTYRISSNTYANKPAKVDLFLKLFFCSILFLITNSIAATTQFAPLILKAVHLTLHPIASAICVGSLIAIASSRLGLALSLSTLYLSYIVIAGFNSSDFSRLSVLDYLFILLFCIFFGSKYFRKSAIKGSKSIGYAFAVFVILQIVALLIFVDLVQLGGDALIVENAVLVIQEAEGRHEYFMPVFNGGLIFLPDYIWPGVKPKAYNSSAWFIENVMGLNPTEYPWGVGISLFASSYLYGGFIGVALVFYSIGAFIGKLSKHVKNSFWAGFLIYFLMRIPFAIFRMDETFLLGAFMPMILTMLVFITLLKQRINKLFTPQLLK